MIIRPAVAGDVAGIHSLVTEYAGRGDLLPRTVESIADTLPDWLVAEQDGAVMACVALLPYSETLAEVRSLAVNSAVHGQGWGAAIVAAAIAEAQRRRIPMLFALTRAVPFFVRAGFAITDKVFFPEKVWRDCSICPVRECCDETAVVLHLNSVPHLYAEQAVPVGGGAGAGFGAV